MMVQGSQCAHQDVLTGLVQLLRYQRQTQVRLVSGRTFCWWICMQIRMVCAGSAAVTCLIVDIFGDLISYSAACVFVCWESLA